MRESVRAAAPILVDFLRDEVEKTGFRDVVFGLSGGIDSALVAYLAVQAFGAERVHPVIMPYRLSSPASLRDAQAIISELGLKADLVEITPQIDAYFSRDPSASLLRRGNKMARERMSILFDHAAVYRALVLGTSNKTELLLGYGTQFGDLGSAVNPIGDLYKSQVRALAMQLGVPDAILRKAPSADLWEEQTDENELGFTYDEADALLHEWVDRWQTRAEIEGLGFAPELIEAVMRRVRLNHYKRVPPIIAKLSSRTIGIDFLYPRDWGM
ncbi:NAD(+) synthetase [Ferroacidibacillus organovorans]|uniref:NH(3)-dependent NAD(+) synthetase n=1 Tax=Ferroacidibacillus organovorans TaxID=1765683 RepID=A0A101XNW0_9BACL|nr:NAD(+) synthetase [Ferroacidibacillus organovorans]